MRASGGQPSLRPPVVHRARTAESLTRLYRESCAIVLRHYRRPLTVAVVARALANSPRPARRAFDDVGETSLSAFLREVRLRNAALLLAPQPLTVRQVSLLVGYRQPAHFAKAFRRRYGVTPARYQPARTNIVGWLRIVARREAIRLARHDRRNAALSAQVMDPCTGAAVTSAVEAASALRALAALPARKRAVLTMRVAGYSHREIGDHLQMTPRTVERQMLRARAAVREGVAAGA